MCGAGWKNSVYEMALENIGVVEEKAETDEMSEAEEASGASYVGCFEDKSSRTLPEFLLKSKTSLTPEECFQETREKKFKYAGLQNGNECWAGDTLPPN